MERASSRGRTIGEWLLAAVSAAVLSSSCGETPAGPASPTTGIVNPPSTPLPGPGVTGIVYGDGAPLPNATVEIRFDPGFVTVKTDADGRYRYAGVVSVPTWLMAHHERFPHQPCAVSLVDALSGSEERTLNIALTTRTGPSSVPEVSVDGRRTVSGTIYETTPTGNQPLGNAFVGWDRGNDDFRAWTQTDDSGRFVLCGLPRDSLWFQAFKQRRAGATGIPSGADAVIEMILKSY